ncbi:unnamed protein product [Prorocentrum cordatum]|uniref:Uncharacterized protein n=1 Tax=Prorocentrum cordatum TaxID=2364126 RepID=A0ABN9RWW7_9DINO|nr:unnamed protein product [Polarella glacialis]
MQPAGEAPRSRPPRSLALLANSPSATFTDFDDPTVTVVDLEDNGKGALIASLEHLRFKGLFRRVTCLALRLSVRPAGACGGPGGEAEPGGDGAEVYFNDIALFGVPSDAGASAARRSAMWDERANLIVSPAMHKRRWGEEVEDGGDGEDAAPARVAAPRLEGPAHGEGAGRPGAAGPAAPAAAGEPALPAARPFPNLPADDRRRRHGAPGPPPFEERRLTGAALGSRRASIEAGREGESHAGEYEAVSRVMSLPWVYWKRLLIGEAGRIEALGSGGSVASDVRSVAHGQSQVVFVVGLQRARDGMTSAILRSTGRGCEVKSLTVWGKLSKDRYHDGQLSNSLGAMTRAHFIIDYYKGDSYMPDSEAATCMVETNRFLRTPSQVASTPFTPAPRLHLMWRMSFKAKYFSIRRGARFIGGMTAQGVRVSPLRWKGRCGQAGALAADAVADDGSKMAPEAQGRGQLGPRGIQRQPSTGPVPQDQFHMARCRRTGSTGQVPPFPRPSAEAELGEAMRKAALVPGHCTEGPLGRCPARQADRPIHGTLEQLSGQLSRRGGAPGHMARLRGLAVVLAAAACLAAVVDWLDPRGRAAGGQDPGRPGGRRTRALAAGGVPVCRSAARAGRPGGGGMGAPRRPGGGGGGETARRRPPRWSAAKRPGGGGGQSRREAARRPPRPPGGARRVALESGMVATPSAARTEKAVEAGWNRQCSHRVGEVGQDHHRGLAHGHAGSLRGWQRLVGRRGQDLPSWFCFLAGFCVALCTDCGFPFCTDGLIYNPFSLTEWAVVDKLLGFGDLQVSASQR